MSNKEIFTKKIKAGSRTYFFDIQESKSGDLYLRISESQRQNAKFEHRRVMVFEENVDNFVEMLNYAFRKFKSFQSKKTKAN
ncbi:DUF3276 family protein [Flavobacterium selenitireducens]|uniref:DUF3276 family protein n=1 Tax=Flavobacterium selenitireducens TaxID=2722704 RepID=UPI00168AF5BB|nr:DUF3276 family protein [Flavobacterium selenitireducens]MBD3581185.1 PUR family DNA/RNA-binding protein [Flavobacterium selenitireducens]